MERAEYRHLKNAITREAERQILAPKSLRRLRIYMYYNLDRPAKEGGVELLWIKLPYAIDRAVEDGALKAGPPRPHGPWLYLPSKETEALHLLDQKVKLYTTWKDQVDLTAGNHGEFLVSKALQQAGFGGVQTRVRTQHGGEQLEIDVITSDPLPLAIQVKNKLSDVYHSPAVAPYGEDIRQIKKHFRFAHDAGLIPVLVASLVDRSFYSFQAQYKGLHYQMKFQYLPADEAEFCERIRRDFGFGNLKATDDPPPWMQHWFNKLESYYHKAYG